MWCMVMVMFMSQGDMDMFPLDKMGDSEVSGDKEVTCYGNHRLIQDVLSWVECDSEGDVKVVTNLDGYDTTYTYEGGVLVSEESVEEEVEED